MQAVQPARGGNIQIPGALWYGSVAGLAAVAVALSTASFPILRGCSPFLLLAPFVVLAARVGGPRSGLVATLIASVLGLIIPTEIDGAWQIAVRPGDGMAVFSFIVLGAGISLLAPPAGFRSVSGPTPPVIDPGAVVEAIGGNSCLVDEGGRVLVCSRRFAELTGQTPDDVRGIHASELFAADGRARFQQALQVAASGEPAEMNGMLSRQANGTRETLPAEVSLRPFGAALAIRGEVLLITVRDLSARRELEMQLKAAGDRILTILRESPDGFLTLDPEWHITYLNREAERHLGIDAANFECRQIWEVFPELSEGPVRESAERAVATGSPTRTELGQPERGRWLDVRFHPYDDGLFVFTVDISDRRRVQQLARARIAVSRVLSAGGDDPTFGQSLLEAVGKNIRWDVGALWLVEPGSPAMACQATWSREPGSLPVLDQHLVGSRLGPGVTLAGKAWQTQEALWLADCTEDSCQERAVCLGAEGIRSSLAVPLRVGGDVLGVIEFFSRTPQAQDALLLDLLSGIGTQIALHLERERWLADPSYATLRLEAAPEPSGLPEPAVEVAVPAPAARSVVPEGRRVPAIPAELQGELKEMLHRAVPRLADWCIITLLDPQGTVAQNLVAHVSPIKAQLLEGVLRSQPLDPQGAPEHPKVLVTGKPEWASVVRPDARQTGVWDHTHLQAFRVLGLRSNYCVPLIWRSELLGALTLATAESGRTLGSDDRPIAQQLAAQITRALVAATGPTPG